MFEQFNSRFQDWRQGKPIGRDRSPHWPEARADWLVVHSSCAVCGFKKFLNVHHIKPFHVFPELELIPSNFITLGEKCPTGNHHLLFGHLGNWSSWNVTVVEDAGMFLLKISKRPGPPRGSEPPLGNIASLFGPLTSGGGNEDYLSFMSIGAVPIGAGPVDYSGSRRSVSTNRRGVRLHYSSEWTSAIPLAS